MKIKSWTRKKLEAGFGIKEIKNVLRKQGFDPEIVYQVLIEMEEKKHKKAPYGMIIFGWLLFGISIFLYHWFAGLGFAFGLFMIYKHPESRNHGIVLSLANGFLILFFFFTLYKLSLFP
jgi:hypothetical protein